MIEIQNVSKKYPTGIQANAVKRWYRSYAAEKPGVF